MAATNRYNEVVLALLAIVWGITLCLPGDLFASVRRFDLLRNFPDWLFGIFLIAPAIFLVQRSSARVRAVIHFIFIGLWLFVGFLVFVQGINEGAILIGMPYIIFALFHAGKFWRLRQEMIP